MGPLLFVLPAVDEASYIEIEYMLRKQHMITGSRLLHANSQRRLETERARTTLEIGEQQRRKTVGGKFRGS